MKLYLMNGLGNRFAIFDARHEDIPMTASLARGIASAERGVGCDQVILMQSAPDGDDSVSIRIWNADGSEVSACGNATRCVAWIIMEQEGAERAIVETPVARLDCTKIDEKTVGVDMGPPKLEWQEIPLAERMATELIDIKLGPIDEPYLALPGVVNMGNPHTVFFVEDISAINIGSVGPLVEGHMLFPEKTNVGFAQIIARDRIRLRVWERGVGETSACGTGACAALVAAHRRGLADRAANIELNGGSLYVEWQESDDHVLMTGPIEFETSGDIQLP